jgi:muconolactone delta-isomerase
MEYLVTMTTHVPEGTPETAVDEAAMAAVLASLPLDAWMTEQTTPLSPHPSDPGLAGS